MKIGFQPIKNIAELLMENTNLACYYSCNEWGHIRKGEMLVTRTETGYAVHYPSYRGDLFHPVFYFERRVNS